MKKLDKISQEEISDSGSKIGSYCCEECIFRLLTKYHFRIIRDLSRNLDEVNEKLLRNFEQDMRDQSKILDHLMRKTRIEKIKQAG